jgi:uncharacterized cupin superfamily protein
MATWDDVSKELSDGLFISRVDTDDWEHDEETGGLVHLLRSDETIQAGLWKPGAVAGRVIEIQLVADEALLVLDGSGELQVNDGPTLELAPGDMVSLKKGARTKWVVNEAFREFWVYT